MDVQPLGALQVETLKAAVTGPSKATNRTAGRAEFSHHLAQPGSAWPVALQELVQVQAPEMLSLLSW